LGNDKINVIIRSLPYYYNDRNRLDYWTEKIKISKLGADAFCFNTGVFHRCPSSLEFLESKFVAYDSWHDYFSPCLFVINHKLSLEITHFRPSRAICPHAHKKRPSTTADRIC